MPAVPIDESQDKRSQACEGTNILAGVAHQQKR